MSVHSCIYAVCRVKSSFRGVAFSSRGSVPWVFAALVLILLPSFTDEASANEEKKFQVLANHLYFFGGVDIAHNSNISWFGATTAPSNTLDEDGMRVRLLGGFGHYRYRAQALIGGENVGKFSTGELQIGKRLSFDPIMISAYGGLEIKNYGLDLPDPDNPANGTKYGAKGTLEIYARLNPNWFVTGYGNISSVYNNYSARVSINHELARYFTLGIEGGTAGDNRSNEMRAGVVGGMAFGKTIFALAGGLLHASDSGKSLSSHLTV